MHSCIRHPEQLEDLEQHRHDDRAAADPNVPARRPITTPAAITAGSSQRSSDHDVSSMRAGRVDDLFRIMAPLLRP
ncbi:hypothetical protein AC629_34275 [Bradyrhizobium sp. NAS80.1]|nr:hypothetical protein AC629_34275 [Bradyrhizobium sp. NAS80.1]